MIKRDAQKELVACCQSIIRNADNITDELEFNQDFEITISLKCGDEIPTVTIRKTIMPKEVIDVLADKYATPILKAEIERHSKK